MFDAAAKYFEECQTNQTSPSIIENSQQCQYWSVRYQKFEQLELTSDTDKLRFIYHDWFDTFTAGLHSEGLAIWEAYVDSIRDINPFHASSGMRNYTKSTAW